MGAQVEPIIWDLTYAAGFQAMAKGEGSLSKRGLLPTTNPSRIQYFSITIVESKAASEKGCSMEDTSL